MLKKAVFQSSKCVVPVNLFSAFEHSESVHNEIETNVFDAFFGEILRCCFTFEISDCKSCIRF